jgi:hypothetical protein
MALSRLGKLDAASALLTQRPAGLRNLLKEMCRTKSLLGIGEFDCIGEAYIHFKKEAIGENLILT